MRCAIGIGLLAALVQDQPVYNRHWQEESILAKNKDPQSGREAAVVQVKFVKPHKLSECLGKEFEAALRDYPCARMFLGGPIHANFRTGDAYHVHLLREDGSDATYVPSDATGLTLSPEDLKRATRLVAVSCRYDVTLDDKRMHFPPYAVSIALEETKDPIAEGSAQLSAQLGNVEKIRSVLADVRPFSDHEFALSVWHEGGAQPIEIGFGEHRLNPRLTFEGAVMAGDVEHRQHVGLYPVPPVARKERGELNIGIGAALFKYKEFPPTLLDLKFPASVEGLEATIQGKLSSVFPSMPLTAVVYSGSIGRDPASFKAAAIELGEKRELEATIQGDGETFFFVTVWSGWKRRGGMMDCGRMDAGASGKYKYVVDPPPRPFYIIRMKGSGALAAASQAIAAGGVPLLAAAILGAGGIGNGIVTGLASPDVVNFSGGGPELLTSDAAGSAPIVVSLPDGVDPSAINLIDGPSSRAPGNGPQPPPPGGGPNVDPKKAKETFSLSASVDRLEFGSVEIGDRKKMTFEIRWSYDDGDPTVLSTKKIQMPELIDGVFRVDAQWPGLVEGKDLRATVTVTFAPAHEKKYLSQLTIQHFSAGLPQVDAKLLLSGEGVAKRDSKAEVDCEKAIDFKAIDLGKSETIQGDKDTGEHLIKVEWDDGDPKKEYRLQIDVEIDKDTEKPKGAFVVEAPNGRRFISKSKDDLILKITFTPLMVGDHLATVKVRYFDESKGKLLGINEIALKGKGKEPAQPGAGGQNPPVGVGVPEGSTFKPTAKYKVLIKDKSGSYIPTEDQRKKGIPMIPGRSATVIPDDPYECTYELHSSSELPNIPTVSAKQIPCPAKDPRVVPPQQIAPGEPYVLETPTPDEPTVQPDGTKVKQTPTVIGTLTLPDGSTLILSVARCLPEAAGKPWTVKDKDGKVIAQFETYYWTPTGPPEIDRFQNGIMTFQRIGKGPIAEVVMTSKNLTMFEVEGDIKDVQLGDGTRATGKVPEGSPKVNIHFKARNMEKEGEIDLVEPKK